ncbi:MAG TPA: ATPase, T2SS/T4P/T4SS family [Kofleriaceae bacterium]|nr:ATPase, T2SS/T4P/T4SS family [Kofleriaceae bacterium]
MEGEARPRRVTVAPETIVDFLVSTALFQGCDRKTVEKIVPHVFPVQVPAGIIIVRAGTPDPGIGFLYEGRAAIRRVDAAAGASITIEEVTVGEPFGEIGAFLGTTQPHDVVAVDDSVMFLLGHDVITQLATRVAAFSFAAARRLATKAITPVPTIVPAVPLGPLPATQSGPIIAARTRSITGLPLAGDAIRFVRVSAYDPTPQVVATVPAKLIRQHRLLPLEVRDRTITIGMVDPTNTASRTELSRVLATSQVAIVAISQDDFNEAYVRLRIDSSAVASHSPGGRSAPSSGEIVLPEQLVFDLADQERDPKQPGPIGEEVVALANRVIAHAVERGASDVHLDYGASGPRVRFRVQGQLYDWDQAIPAAHAKGLVARLKVLAGLDVTERRLPQDGRLGVRVGRREVDIRISTMPASRGEKVALRVFEAAAMQRQLETIFYDAATLDAVRAAIQRPYGAIVVAGPTGSGKTSTLYAALGERMRTRPDTNALTVEDPIEYRLAGVTQVQVNHAVDLGFAKVLRAMLRQDPDVMMVGEVRDEETARLALEAAMTGHLMLTSLHANNAAGVIQRLEHLGCGRPLIGQSLALALVQRLARRLCPRCTTLEVPPPIVVENLAAHGLADRRAAVPLPRAVGCPDCGQTGYAGRVAVVEMLLLDEELRAQIMAGASPAELERAAAGAGSLVSFRASALGLMARQLISPAEALLILS